MQLTFSEQPEASLSEIHVLGPGGETEEKGSPKAPAGEPLALSVPVPALSRGVYTVSWKVVSAVDGHATAGTYAFGVGVSPQGAAATSSTSTASSSRLELVSRWILLLGIVALLGGAVAAMARFGGSSGSDLALAGGGWAVSTVGLLMLADAQRQTADSTFDALLDTSVGRALIWRAVALAVAGVGLLIAWRRPKARRAASAAVAAGAVAMIVVHVAAGHAAAGNWPSAITIAAQAAHFVAAGIWFGGLAALLLGVRGAPSVEKTAAIRRFAIVAFAALIVVFVTGTLRAIDELASWGDLVNSGYGRAVLAKVALIVLIAWLAARNRNRSLPVASEDLRPLRRTARWELALAVVALAVAALLGTLAPPVSGQSGTAAGLSASGADFGTTTRVELTTTSDQPGPNRFQVEVDDYDSGEALHAGAVSLRFTPLDDPGVEPSSLKLEPGPDGTYVGAGANLAFDGRWGVDVTVEEGGEAIEVPLELEVPGPKQFVSVLRIPGRIPKYTMQIGTLGDIRIEPDPQRAGPSKVYVTCFTAFGSTYPIDQLVVTADADGSATHQQPVRRINSGRFVADIDLDPGPFAITVVAHTRYGTRLRGAFQLKIPAE